MLVTVDIGVDRRAVPSHGAPDAGHGVFGAADSRFHCVVRAFSTMFPGHRFGGGALAVYLDGHPVVDVWKGWADRDGKVPWSADSAPMVFSATKGMAATVIHRLADRGLMDGLGSLTPDGRELKDQLEATTDALALRAFDALDDDELQALFSALTPVARAVIGGGDLPPATPMSARLDF